jgi:hypothetical protein
MSRWKDRARLSISPTSVEDERSRVKEGAFAQDLLNCRMVKARGSLGQILEIAICYLGVIVRVEQVRFGII